MKTLTGLRKVCQLRGIKNSHSFNTERCLKELGKTKFTKEEEKAYYEAIERRKEQRRKKPVEKVIIKNDDVELLKNKLKDLEEVSDIENDNIFMTKELITLKKSIQKKDDIIRLFRKKEREYDRELNVLESQTLEFIKLTKETYSKITLPKHQSIIGGKKGISHYTDTHMNEQINILGNKYNFKEASRRIRFKTLKDIEYLKSEGITDLVIVYSGDLLNSDRRLGEILTNSTNRAKAIFNARDIFLSSILEYAKYFNVSVASVIGNESRIDEDIFFEEQLASNNFDYTILEMVKDRLQDTIGGKVHFIKNINPLETIIEVNNQNILILHGHTLPKNPESAIPKLKAKYADQGIIIRYILFGHYHGALNSSEFTRSASTAGGNEYSFFALHLSSRATQSLMTVDINGNIDSIMQDLQVVPDFIEPYKFPFFEDCYTKKSLEKYKKTNGLNIYKV